MFGQTQGFGLSPFGAAPASNPFGGAFGQASAPAAAAPSFSSFAAPKPAFGGFGFGAASQPSFGAASSAPAAFGAQPTSAFGAAPAFGAASTPSFGASPAPAPFFGAAAAAPAQAFGATGAFGATTFGGSAAAPAFGGAAAPAAFGASTLSPGFGAFGAAPAAAPFGSTGGLFGFGAQQQQQQQQQIVGTRAVAFQKTSERENSAQGSSAVSNYLTITAMPVYQNKSQEELRWEDYQQGVKSSAAGPPQQQAASNAFGGPTQFGNSAANAFGATTSTFGSPSSTSAFNTTGATTGAFGSTMFGGAMGASFAPASQPTTSFTSAPSFAAPPLGGSIFGSAPAASTGGFSFNSNTGSLFGSTSLPASSPSLFGQQPAPAANPFGSSSPFSAAAPSTSLFGNSAPAFGAGGAFGAKPTFSFNSSPATGGGFSLPGFATTGTSPGLFSTNPSFAPAATTGAFSFNPSPGLFGTPGQFSMPGATTSSALVPAQGPPLNVGQAPYGSFPLLPTVSEPKVGISARPMKSPAGGNGANIRGSPLLSLRSASATPKFGAQPRSNAASPLALISATPSPQAAGGSSSSAPSLVSANGSAAPVALLPTRANPYRLFIREPPPGTEAATSLSAAPAALQAAPRSNGTPDRSNNYADTGGPSEAGDELGDSSSLRRAQRARRVPHPLPSDTPTSPLLPSPTCSRPVQAEAANGGSSIGHHPAANGSSSPRGREATASRSALDVLPRLGRLAADGYTYEPSATQLEAMYRSDPASIKQVMNFTVTRRGVGYVRWLRPVDVTGLSLDRIIVIEEGEVVCYADDSKPPVGQGLNTNAEIVLYGIYKIDKVTKQRIQDGPAVIKWEKTLRSMCAQMGAHFIYYKPTNGAWKFEVEHFSRYGLLHS